MYTPILNVRFKIRRQRVYTYNTWTGVKKSRLNAYRVRAMNGIDSECIIYTHAHTLTNIIHTPVHIIVCKYEREFRMVIKI